MINQLTFWLFLFTMLASVSSTAQTPFYIKYDTQSGLPSSEVYNIHFTPDKKAWFTTDRGVATYNGYEFTTYYSQDGLKTNTNFNIFEDSKNQLWFTGIDGSLSMMRNGEFIDDPMLDSLKALIHPNFFFTPIENDNGQLLLFNRRSYFNNKKYIIWNVINNHIEMITIEELKERYLVQKGSDFNLIQFGSTVIALDNSEEIGFYKPLVKHKTAWIGFSYYDVYKINNQGNIEQTSKLEGRIDFCYIDQDKDLWLGTNVGLYYFEDANLDSEPQLFFPKLNITDLKEDFEGNYWMSTGDEGVYFIPDLKINTLSFIDKNSKSGRILSSEALEHRIYFGSYWGEVFSIDKNLNLDTILNPTNPTAKNLNHSYKVDNSVFFMDHGLIEHDDNSISKIPKEKIKFTMLFTEFEDGFIYSDGKERFIIKEDDNTLIKSKDIYAGLIPRIACMEKDQKGNIWIGTYGGLFKVVKENNYKMEKDSLHHVTSKQRIQDLKTDYYGNIWVATIGHGLIYLTPDSIYQFEIKDGLQSDLINCLYIQENNTLWVGTNQGINRILYKYDQGKCVIDNIHDYNVMDGLPSNFINAIEFWNDYLWLATNEGIVYIKPELLKVDHPNVSIYLEHFVVNGKNIKPEKGIKLEPTENDIFLQMTGVSYRKENRNDFYRYRLSESSKTTPWKYTNERNIQFLDLPPGKYTFEAAAKNKSEKWSHSPIVLEFEIMPFFTQTRLFRGLMFALGLGSIGLLFLLRDKQLKKRNQLQHKLMEEKMKAKDYELAALRNQMNPHFVFNSLNSIQSYIFKKNPLKANYYLSKFSSLMRDSLQFSRLKYIGLQEEIRFLSTYLELEQMRFPNMFDFDIKIDDHIPIKQYAIPSLLFQPVLENVIKHAFKEIDYKGMIEIIITDDIPGKSLSVKIKDNGSGYKGNFFKESSKINQHESLGLTIVKNQIEALNMETVEPKASFQIDNLAEIDATLTGVMASFIIPIKSRLSKIQNAKILTKPKNNLN